MKILVVGNGAREHAIAWKLDQSPQASEIFVAPGNAGTAQFAINVSIGAGDIDCLLRFAKENQIGFTIIGPEAPLAEGIVDRFREAGALVFGPTRAAAQIESSKSFAKKLMIRSGIPTGSAEVFSDYSEARRYVEQCAVPVVIKADGLAAGKGVVVAQSRDDALEALRQQMEEKLFGSAGDTVLVEECLEGREISVFAFVDGEYVSPMVAACDYKRVGDGDIGPNTGGMGSYSPPTAWNDELQRGVRNEIMLPTAKALADDGTPYQGMLYAGLMLTAEGPKVIEFNCRLGDPEAQVTLPRLKSDLLEVMMKTALGKLEGVAIEWDSRACVGVVVASGGYPGSYKTGYQIAGLDCLDDGATIFHAGTKLAMLEGDRSPMTATNGGRVLTVSALGDTIGEARDKVYANVGRIRFQGSFYRGDIAENV